MAGDRAVRDSAQSTDVVVMIRPVRFESNAQTAANNSFQDLGSAPGPAEAQAGAAAGFARLVAALEGEGVRVIVFDDTEVPHTPDAIFPNNWVSTHADGSVILYPMCAPNRRAERRMDILDALASEHSFRVERLIDLSGHERDGQFLEGTGSLVLDRPAGIAYACRSARTDAEVLQRFAATTGYRVHAFTATDADGAEIYHTNVLMCVGTAFVVVCSEAIPDPIERDGIETELRAAGREIVRISRAQMAEFAGNMLELRDADGGTLIAISARALASLSEAQRQALTRWGRLVAVDIDTIEDCAGGSVRCMIAEVHLPMATGRE